MMTNDFNLNLAKQGKQVVTADGRFARIICYDCLMDGNEVMIALILDEKDNCEHCHFYHLNGCKSEYHRSSDDLFMYESYEED